MKNKLKLYDFSLLKSNMDRFIDYANRCDYIFIKVLKSNMDRFIDGAMAVNHITPENLKSNMDRFIALLQANLLLL